METEGLDFKGALESLADRFGVKLETEDEDPEAAARRAAARAAARAAGPRRHLLLALPVGGARGAAGARATCSAAGSTEETLREFRVGYAPSAWDRMLLASRRAGFSEEELLAAGLAQRSRRPAGQRLRPLPRADHVPGRRRARAGARLRRAARCATTSAAQVPQHLRRRALPQAQVAVRHRPRPRAGGHGRAG